ncbi:MAG: hypothetical protein ABI343_06475 [Burkholderiaceae bacterium]
MAIGWMTAIKLVPWTDVVGHAPTVIAAARKLWNGKSPPPPVEVDAVTETTHGLDDGAPALAAIESQLANLESVVADLDGKLAASIAVVKELAEQNAQLIRRIEANRVKTVRLSIGLGVTFLAALAALFAVYLR